MHKFEIEMLGTPYRSTRVVKWSRHEKSDISSKKKKKEQSEG